MFDLNNSPKFEQKMASSYFLKAGSLYHPEAVGFLAREKFFQLKTLMLGRSKSAKDLDMNCQEKLQEFLEWFKKVAYMGLISKDQVEFLKNTKLVPFLSEEVIDLIKRNEAIDQSDEIISKIILCSNRECHEIIEENAKGFFCKLCLKVLYCSRTCKKLLVLVCMQHCVKKASRRLSKAILI